MTKLQSALLATATFALGAATIQGLHAQMKPLGYFISEVNVKDEHGFNTEFLPPARKAIAEFGGKYIAGGFNKTLAISGEPPPTASSFCSSRTWIS